MKLDVLRAEDRGHLNFGWLDTYHTFSFGEYYNRDRINFGALRVINDDTIAPQSMFPIHPHKDMEIITIVLKGSVKHQDTLGNKTTINAGEIQIMSAGTGIQHSEANRSLSEDLCLFQIWIYPQQKSLMPRYAQHNFSHKLKSLNQWHQLINPNVENKNVLHINQNAYLSMGEFDDTSKNYSYIFNNKNHGVLIMVISGEMILAEYILTNRDAIMLTECTKVKFMVNKTTKLLLIEVPLNI